MTRVAIVGGGISGLAAAYFCILRSRESGMPVEVTVLEADRRWGGKVRSENVDGFVIEGGPDAFLSRKPWALELCKALGLDDRLIGTGPTARKTYVLHDGRLQPLPEGLAMMLPADLAALMRTPLLSGAQKVRAGLDLLIPPRPVDGDESLGEFVSRRLGRGAYENLVEPLMSGIYAGDGDRLSLAATFPALRDVELRCGSLIRGARAERDRAGQAGTSADNPRPAFLTPAGGLVTIVDALVAFLEKNGADLRLGAPVHALTSSPHSGFRLDSGAAAPLEAEAVVLALPAFAGGNLLERYDPGLSRDLRAIPYASTATISLAYRRADVPRPLDGSGYVIPRREGRRLLACTWTSSKFPGRAPDGSVLLRLFAGRAGDEGDLPEDAAGLLELARQELRLTLGIAAAPILSRVFRWENAMPQYNLGHLERLARIDAALAKHPGLALAGNAYRGVGLPDCIRSGELAAGKVMHEVMEVV